MCFGEGGMKGMMVFVQAEDGDGAMGGDTSGGGRVQRAWGQRW